VKQEDVISNLWHVLTKPATTYEELAVRIENRTGERVNRGMVAQAVTYLRSNTEEYGWTVPHVKRGPAGGGDDGRYFRMLLDHKNGYHFVEKPEQLEHMERGTLSTLRQTVTMSKAQITMLKGAHENLRSHKMRAELKDTIEDYEYATRRMERIVRSYEEAQEEVEEANGTTGKPVLKLV